MQPNNPNQEHSGDGDTIANNKYTTHNYYGANPMQPPPLPKWLKALSFVRANLTFAGVNFVKVQNFDKVKRGLDEVERRLGEIYT